MNTLSRVLRFVCYLALAVVAGSVVVLVGAVTLGGCTQGGDSFVCASSAVEGAANAANIVLLTSAFTLIPSLLALGGIFFLIRDLLRRHQASRSA